MPLKIMLWRSPSPTSSAIGSDVLRHRQALARERRLRRLQRGGLDQPRVGGNGVAFFDEDDVAGHDLGRRDALPLAVADDVGMCRRHLAQRRHRLLRARLLNVAHDRVEQHDGEDRDRFVGQRRFALVQPQPRRDHRGDEQQDDEHVLELREELPPGRHGLLRRQLVPAVPFEPRPRLSFAQAAPRVRVERSQYFLNRLLIRSYLCLAESSLWSSTCILCFCDDCMRAFFSLSFTMQFVASIKQRTRCAREGLVGECAYLRHRAVLTPAITPPF